MVRIKVKQSYRLAFGFFAAGLALALGQAPFGLIWIAFPALCYAFWLFPKTQIPARAGWLFGVGYFGLSLIWIVEPFYIEPDVYGWMAPFGLSLGTAGLALYWGAAFWLAARLKGAHFTLAFALTGFEMLRGLGPFGGFAWNPIAAIWLDYGPDQGIAFYGVNGLSLLSLLLAGALAKYIHEPRGRILGLCGIIAAMMVLPALRTPPPKPAPNVIIRLVQPNIPQGLKYDPDQARFFFERTLKLSTAEGQNSPAPVAVIWPESGLTMPYKTAITYFLPAIAEQIKTPLFISGITRRDAGGFYNSLIVAHKGQQIAYYDKYRLVPFGEYIPGEALLRNLALKAIAQGRYDYGRGPGQLVLDIEGLGKILPLICFEATFPLGRQNIHNRPDWILNISNDAWFGDWIGPHQHLAQARLRALELGLPLLRAANTGISAVIDTHGRVLSKIDINQTGYLDVRLPPALAPPLYARIGDGPLGFLIIAALGAIWRRKQHFLD